MPLVSGMHHERVGEQTVRPHQLAGVGQLGELLGLLDDEVGLGLEDREEQHVGAAAATSVSTGRMSVSPLFTAVASAISPPSSVNDVPNAVARPWV